MSAPLFPLRALALFWLISSAPSALADTRAEALGQEQFRQDELRRQQFEQLLLQNTDVRLDSAAPSVAPAALPQNETPCFAVNRVLLHGDSAGLFQASFKRALADVGFEPGMCLGAQGINRLMAQVQNAFIGKGYITTRVLAAPQDLGVGELVLTVFPGRIGRIRFDEENAAQTHVERIMSFRNEFPVSDGEILNLRDLEHGLENLKRVPTAEADIQIVPSETPDVGDVLVQWRQRTVPYRLTLGFDNSGGKATGRYQGSAALSADNPFGLSDLFYASFNRGLGGRAAATGADGNTVEDASQGYAFHYSVPAGKWLWSWNHSYYRYHQAVAGDAEVYDYNGKSRTSDVGVGRLFYRDARRKTQLSFKLWRRETQSFINDAEIAVQRRKNAGWSAQLAHKEFLGASVLNFGLGYKRGTGRDGSLSAPDETTGRDIARLKILTADIGAEVPFRLGRQNLMFESNLHMQRSGKVLMPQDRLSIGGRYTVRGFDGERSLSAERGGYWRNDISWLYLPQHRLYLGLDAGRVSGPSAAQLSGRSLSGAAVGARGQFKAGGVFFYDVFAAKPLKKPERFQTAKTTFGLNLNYSF